MTNKIGDTRTVTVIGGGLAGTLCAIYLARFGFDVEVFERNPDPRKDQSTAGRSINLALAERGISALRQMGLHHRIARIALPMRGRMIHDYSGGQHLQPYGQNLSEVIYSIHRAELNRTLLDAAEGTKRVRVHFGQKLERLDFDGTEATFLDQSSGRRYQRPVFPMIACDGAGSRVRRSMERYAAFASDADLLDHGYRELTMPAQHGEPVLANDALHIWPRNNYMMIALPNADHSFTTTLFMAKQNGARQRASFAALEQTADARSFFAEKFPDALSLLTGFDVDWDHNPIGVLGTVRCPQWHVGGKALLLGDAAHAIVPFHGQGMNAAFEDCPALLDCLREHRTWHEAFAAFQLARQPNTNAIADMALENYIEMRDSVIDPAYRLRRLLERELERRHPDHFVPRYSLVMFRRLPYSQAQARGRTNLEILKTLTQSASSLDEIDYQAADHLIQSKLDPLTGP